MTSLLRRMKVHPLGSQDGTVDALREYARVGENRVGGIEKLLRGIAGAGRKLL